MMTMPKQESLIALFLALQDYSGTLTEAERGSLDGIKRGLDADASQWERYIAADLQTFLDGNAELNEGYQTYFAALTKLDADSLAAALPDDAEMEEITPTQELVARGFKPSGSTDAVKGDEINNIAVRILTTPKPEETVKKSSTLERFKRGIQESLG